MKRSPILLAMLFLAACDGYVDVSGVVRDTERNPIAGARVVLDKENWRRFEGETDSEGCFDLGGIVPSGRYKYDVLVEADGFGSVRTKVRAGRSNLLEVQLERSGSAKEGVIQKSEAPIPCR